METTRYTCHITMTPSVSSISFYEHNYSSNSNVYFQLVFIHRHDFMAHAFFQSRCLTHSHFQPDLLATGILKAAHLQSQWGTCEKDFGPLWCLLQYRKTCGWQLQIWRRKLQVQKSCNLTSSVAAATMESQKSLHKQRGAWPSHSLPQALLCLWRPKC